MTYLEELRATWPGPPITMASPMLGECFVCGELVEIGEPIVWNPKLPKYRTTRHAGCVTKTLGMEKGDE